MKYMYLTYTLLLLCTSCSHLNRFVELKPTFAKARNSFLNGNEMDVIVFDGRPKNNFTDNMEEAIFEHLAASYPALKISRPGESAFFGDPQNGRLTLKLSIIRHNVEHIDFSSSDDDSSCSLDNTFINAGNNGEVQEVGRTVIDVSLYDCRLTERRWIDRISGKAYGGQYVQGVYYHSLQRSFQQVMDKLCSFLDVQLME